MSNDRPQVRVEVRQATDEDLDLAFAITEEAMRQYVEATWGRWEPEEQRKLHAKSFEPSTHWVVLSGGEPVGIVAAELERSHVQLVKLYLCARARGQGIGAVILSALLRSAALRSQPLRLRVLAVNTRAQAFYIRHGFHESSRTAQRVFMEASFRPGLGHSKRQGRGKALGRR
jgi:GNAT superfamily N-acetyltransferase